VTGLQRFLRYGFAICERERSGRHAQFRPPNAEESALGIPEPQQPPETFYQTIEHAGPAGARRLRARRDRGLARAQRDPVPGDVRSRPRRH
jgi:hypothetical protein